MKHTTNQAVTGEGNAPRVDAATSQIITELKHYNPSRHFAIEEKGGSLGVWDKVEKRYFLIASRAITGEWVLTQQDILVNGQPIPRNWIEV